VNNNLLSAFFVGVAAAKEEEPEEDEDAVVAWMPPRYHRCANCVAPRRVLCADAILSSSSYIYVFMYLYVCSYRVLIRKVKREGFSLFVFPQFRRQQGRERKRPSCQVREKKRRRSEKFKRESFSKKNARSFLHTPAGLFACARGREN